MQFIAEKGKHLMLFGLDRYQAMGQGSFSRSESDQSNETSSQVHKKVNLLEILVIVMIFTYHGWRRSLRSLSPSHH